MENMKDVCYDALATKAKFTTALLLDLMLLEAEAELGMMDGLPLVEEDE